MPTIRFKGIPTAMAQEVRATMRAPHYGHPAHRELATGYGPCRHCLRTFDEGKEDRILFTYTPFKRGSLPLPGPVFIHAEPCERYDSELLPPDLRRLPMVVEGFAEDGRVLLQERVNGEGLDAVVARVAAVEGVAGVHLRNAEAGCFMARGVVGR